MGELKAALSKTEAVFIDREFDFYTSRCILNTQLAASVARERL